MLRKIWIVLLAVVFIGSMSLTPMFDSVHAAPKCQCKGDGKDCSCGKDCKCDHCAAGKNGKDCQCGKDCKCDHCKTGKGSCQCKTGTKGCQCKGDGKDCSCGKDCKCDHCAAGKSDKGKAGKGCKCNIDGKGACHCGKDCKCDHCKTGKGTCHCKGDGKKGCQCGKDCKCDHCAKDNAAAATKPAAEADYAATMTSKDRLYKVTYSSDAPAMSANKLISWKLKVEAADGKPVSDAEITVTGDMPEHGHGLPTQPKVTKNLGDGSYLVEGIKFSMNGWWTMTFSIKSASKTDSVTFNLQVK
ncbi:MAG: hypothetical protein C0402_03510 [Thermodesulfovibrio sp.]|nr:hypothetical protein [Thermodesulfovibrio sp.]